MTTKRDVEHNVRRNRTCYIDRLSACAMFVRVVGSNGQNHDRKTLCSFSVDAFRISSSLFHMPGSSNPKRICQVDVSMPDRSHGGWQHASMRPLRHIIAVETDTAWHQSKNGMILAKSNVVPWPPFGPPLPHDYASRLAALSMKQLHSQPLRLRAFRVLGGASSFLRSGPNEAKLR
jgi:hypothetical protein